MSKLLVESFANSSSYELRIVRCEVKNEHEDNDRFCADVQRWIGYKIETIRSEEFSDCFEVWEKRRYMSGVHGAPCTTEMKKVPRWKLESEWSPDFQAFGFSVDEKERADTFAENNPEIRLLRILETQRISKKMCAIIVSGVGIELPVLYRMGFSNNNCICCVKAQSPGYWARSRHYFPEQFARTAELSRRLGVRLVKMNNVRIFIDEIPLDYNWRRYDRSRGFECGLLCGPIKRIR